uniref:NADH dehydrogenase subunit 2 n=1 Tax=Jaagichlorella hainangensis TaxID=445995 RepID=A0A6M8U614_9CHLO|nr:NADH dehydrogenase subunit 2 [Jaagichlorella hainangensis]QKJ84934.1 NADH dehydrogenase subunit 2 [Jaagichlorella hainangensis]
MLLLFENDLKSIIPELFLVISFVLLLLYGLFLSSSNEKSQLQSYNIAFQNDTNINTNIRSLTGYQNFQLLTLNSSWISILVLLLTCILLCNNPIGKILIFYNSFFLDDFSRFLKVLVVIGTALSILISFSYYQQERLNWYELQTIICLSSSSLLFLISSVDFISIYLVVELQSLCFYVLAGIKRDSEFSTEAGLKYFLLGALSSGLLLFGCGLIYGFTGLTYLSELSKILQSQASGYPILLDTSFEQLNNLSVHFNKEWGNSFSSFYELFSVQFSEIRNLDLGIIFILVGFLFKLTAVPFHTWAPDVYEGAPTCITAYFAIVPKIAILGILVRICYTCFYDSFLSVQKILIVSSIGSMILGSYAALSQNKMKRLLAWSSIGHVGFLLIAVCSGTVEGLQALCVYLVIYLIMTINLFTLVLAPLRREIITHGDGIEENRASHQSFYSSKTNVKHIKYITDLSFLAKINPVLAITLTITMFSIAGIPPLAGFFSKAFLMFVAMSACQYILAIIAILTSVISCFYYIRLVKIMYFEKSKKQLFFVKQNKEISLVFGITFIFILFFCLNPSSLFVCTHLSALQLSS